MNHVSVLIAGRVEPTEKLFVSTPKQILTEPPPLWFFDVGMSPLGYRLVDPALIGKEFYEPESGFAETVDFIAGQLGLVAFGD